LYFEEFTNKVFCYVK